MKVRTETAPRTRGEAASDTRWQRDQRTDQWPLKYTHSDLIRTQQTLTQIHRHNFNKQMYTRKRKLKHDGVYGIFHGFPSIKRRVDIPGHCTGGSRPAIVRASRGLSWITSGTTERHTLRFERINRYTIRNNYFAFVTESLKKIWKNIKILWNILWNNGVFHPSQNKRRIPGTLYLQDFMNDHWNQWEPNMRSWVREWQTGQDMIGSSIAKTEADLAQHLKTLWLQSSL